MSRPSKIWYWKARKEWYVTIAGRRHRLGPNKKDATQKFHEMMASPVDNPPVDPGSVASIFDEFLEWTKQNRADKTYEGYVKFCQSFLDKWPRLNTKELRPRHVQEWLNSKPNWNSTTRRGAITALKRTMNWAVRMGYVQASPIAGMEKPEAKTRATVVTEAEFENLLAAVGDDEFKDLLIVSYDCGARPQEVKQLEARHVDLEQSLWVLPTREAKGKRKPRVVYIATKRSLEIIRRRVGEYPEGVIFRNTRGNPWTGPAVKCRFDKLEQKLGKRYRQYDFRHTWITNKLIAGVDSHIVAKLAGHSDVSMIHKVYSHVAEDHEFMLKQAMKQVDSEKGSMKQSKPGGRKRRKAG